MIQDSTQEAGTYSAYGLTIASALPLPELAGAPGAGMADVTIMLGDIQPAAEAGGTQIGPVAWIGPGKLWLDIPGIARFLVEDGARITVQPAPGIDADSIRLFLLGSALGTVLLQRGLLVLHACAVRVGDGAVLVLGDSGAGKSTLALSLLRRGHQLLADDVVALDAAGLVLAGPRRLKIWADALDQLEIARDGLRHVRPQLEKFDLTVAADAPMPPSRLLAAYTLTATRVESVELEALGGMDKAMALTRHVYRRHFAERLGLSARHLGLAAAVARKTRMARIKRPVESFALDALTDCILDDLRHAG